MVLTQGVMNNPRVFKKNREKLMWIRHFMLIETRKSTRPYVYRKHLFFYNSLLRNWMFNITNNISDL